jgi:hypothetical protein
MFTSESKRWIDHTRQQWVEHVATSAQQIATYDDDLLSLRKPFGIELIRPAE